MRDIIQWIALFGMVGIAILFIVEVRKWRLLGNFMTRNQRAIRSAMFLAIELLFAMMIVGPWMTSRNPLTSLLYWTACLVVGLVVMLLFVLDLRTVVRQYARLNRQIFHELKEPTEEDYRRRMRPEDNGHKT